MGLIPTPYKYLAYGLLLLSLLTTVYIKGMSHVQDQWNRAIEKENLAILKKVVLQEKITTKIVTEYVDRVKVVKEKGQTITKEIPVYVTSKNDSQCIINNGFIRLHDAAAKNTIPDPTGIINEAASTFKLSRVLGTVTGNYQICHENSEQLKSLQQWVREQSELK